MGPTKLGPIQLKRTIADPIAACSSDAVMAWLRERDDTWRAALISRAMEVFTTEQGDRMAQAARLLSHLATPEA